MVKVQQRLGTQHLVDAHGRYQAQGVVWYGRGRVGQAHVLGTHAQNHVAALLGQRVEGGGLLAGQLGTAVLGARTQAAPLGA